MGINVRQSGHSYERFVAVKFREIGWPDAKRHQENQWQEALAGTDLDYTHPFNVQIKNCRDYKLSAIHEVSPEKGKYPLLITNKKGKQHLTLAVMFIPDLIELFEMDNKRCRFGNIVKLKDQTNRWRDSLSLLKNRDTILMYKGYAIMNYEYFMEFIGDLKKDKIL